MVPCSGSPVPRLVLLPVLLGGPVSIAGNGGASLQANSFRKAASLYL